MIRTSIGKVLRYLRASSLGPLFLVRFIPGMLLIIALAIGFYYSQKSVSETILKKAESDSVEYLTHTISSRIGDHVREFGLLAGHLELRNYLDSGDEASRKAVEKEFLTSLKISNNIEQIRLLNFSGNEDLKVYMDSGNPKIAVSADLQSKSSRYYFQSILQLPVDHVYASPLDLNIEQGEIEYPLKPIFRLATIVWSGDHLNRKILIVNFRGDSILQLEFPGIGAHQLLVDSQGYYLKSFNPTMEWGSQIEDRRQHNFAVQYPEIWEALQGGNDQLVGSFGLVTNSVIDLASDLDSEGSLMFEDPNFHWMLISFVPRNDLDANDGLLGITLGTAGALLVLGFICFLSANRRVAEVRAKLQLQKSESRYRELLDTTRDLIWRCGRDARVTYVNPAWERTFGYTQDELVGRAVRDLLPAPTALNFFDFFNRVLEGEEIIGVKQTIFAKSGNAVHLVVNFMPTIDAHGDVVGVHGHAMDVTQLIRAEDELRNSESRFRGLAENSPDIIWRADLQGVIVYVSPALLPLTGFDPTELIGTEASDFFKDTTSKKRAAKTFYQHVKGEAGAVTHERLIPCKNGGSITVDVTSVPVSDNSGEIIEIQGIIRDVSQVKKMESELLKMEKLESVGVLAGGIAHDLNNLLTAIMGNLSLARMSNDRAEREGFLGETEKALQRLKDLNQQLLTFSKGGLPVLDTNNIQDLIDESVRFSMHGSNVAANLVFADDLSLVDVDPGQINQVMNNLLINACHAMPGGGDITISAQNVTITDQSEIPVAPGGYVKVSIEDGGSGISDELLPNIFDPFFTTKQSGSGLGLATAYSIIQKHHGYISVKSTMDEGTRFDIYLPASEHSVPVELVEQQISLVPGEGRILVMDDSPNIRDLMQVMLVKLGYTASVSEDGEQAITLYKEALNSGKPFHLVIMDLTVPGGMGGKETIEKLLEIDPEIVAIVSSGYAVDPVISNYREYGFSGVLAKPYSLSKMRQVLADTLSVSVGGREDFRQSV